jgi:thymidylate synthase
MIFTSYKVKDIRKNFIELKEQGKIVEDRTGVKVIELINASFIADEESIFGKPNDDWHQRELEWYLSQSLNINDIPGKIPKIWKQVADVNGFICSNYGWCVFSEENGYQYVNVLKTLTEKDYSRQGIMIYTRPTMHTDAYLNGRTDFMCCQYSQHFIRDGELISIFNFRSNDGIFGYKGDNYWAKYIHSRLFNDLRLKNENLIKGPVLWNAMSLHIYERHWNLIG